MLLKRSFLWVSVKKPQGAVAHCDFSLKIHVSSCQTFHSNVPISISISNGNEMKDWHAETIMSQKPYLFCKYKGRNMSRASKLYFYSFGGIIYIWRMNSKLWFYRLSQSFPSSFIVASPTPVLSLEIHPSHLSLSRIHRSWLIFTEHIDAAPEGWDPDDFTERRGSEDSPCPFPTLTSLHTFLVPSRGPLQPWALVDDSLNLHLKKKAILEQTPFLPWIPCN